MRRFESEHELEAEYRDFEPGLPRIDLVLGVALSVLLGAGGLFGYGWLPGVLASPAQQDVASAESAQNFAPEDDFDVTAGLRVSLSRIEDMHVLRVIGCREQDDSAVHELNWTLERTDSGPAL